MEKNNRRIKYAIAEDRARKVRRILRDHGITFGEALSFSSEVFQLLFIMGELPPILTKTLAYIAVKLQGTEMDTMTLGDEYDGLLDKPKLFDSSSETSGNTGEDKG